MKTVFWKNDCCVGDTIIDSHHQYLFSLATELVASTDKTELTNNAMKLTHYVRKHFKDEEAEMRQILHQEFIAVHDALKTQLSTTNSWSRADLQQFMNKWLAVHIVEDDTKLCGCIKND